MVKWQKYAISEVRYNEDHNNIIKVKLIKPLENFEYYGIVVRSEIVKYLEKNKLTTVIKNNDGEYDCENVHIYDKKWIRTDPNDKDQDNLGKLPEF